MLRAALIFVVALFAQLAAAQGVAPHRISAGTQQIKLTGAVGVLEDSSAKLTVSEVAALAESGAMKIVANPRISMFRIDRGEATWLKLDVIADASAPRDWMLEMARSAFDHIQVYQKSADGQWIGFPEAGAAMPFSARVVDHRHFVYPVRLDPAGAASFLVRIRYAGPSAPQATLWQPAALQAADRTALGFSAIYFGLVAGMLLYNILLYVSVRDIGYLLYAACAACTAAAFAAMSGVGAQFVWGEASWWNSHAIYSLYAAALTFSAHLTRQFLKTKERLPTADKALQALAWGSTVGFVAALVLPSNLAAILLIVLGSSLAILVPGVAAVGVVRRWPGARFFGAAWTMMYLAVLVLIVRQVATLPDNVLFENALAIGSAFEMILLSLALADRINDERRQKEQAQSLALGVLQASQAFSSETRLDRLHGRVCEIMMALTGAQSVRFVLRDADLREWFMYEGGGRISLEEAVHRGLVPSDALRRAEQTGEGVVASDAWMVLRVSHHGELSALVLLENRHAAGEFAPEACATIEGIAGSLAVSLENVLLYERLEQHVAERTQELREAQQELVATARRAGMAEIATNVLHNVGNTLNSVNVGAELMRSRLGQSTAERLVRVVDLIDAHQGNLGHFFQHDIKGRVLPKYLRELGEAMLREREDLQAHLERVITSVDHIKRVVATQQAYAGASGVLEACSLTELVDDALRIQQDALTRHAVTVSRDYAQVEPAPLDKTRVMQILVNLIENARQAMQEIAGPRNLSVAVAQESGWLSVRVRDSGRGIKADNLARIFTHGFTTKAGGHGFGLHSCAVAAKEMGGTLSVHSGGGPGLGATFTLQLPRQAVLGA